MFKASERYLLCCSLDPRPRRAAILLHDFAAEEVAAELLGSYECRAAARERVAYPVRVFC